MKWIGSRRTRKPTSGLPESWCIAPSINGATEPFDSLSDQDWRETIDVNLMGAVRMCRAFIPQMIRQGWGRVVLTGLERRGCASKAGILNLAKGLSKTYARQGVLVNAVAPAFMATPMTDAMMEKRAKERSCSFDEAIEVS